MSGLYLVDDHALVREGLRALLEAAGHEVLGETADPTTAVADIARLAPDVVLLDLSLGERSGFEVLEQVRRRDPSARLLVLTMSAQPRHVGEAMRLGAAGYVLKGSPGRELLRAIEQVVQGRRHIGAEVADLAVQALTGGAPDRLASLSPRERQILVMVVKGQSSAAIGTRLHLSPKTVDTYRSRLMQKLGIADVPALVRLAIREGLIDAHDA
ncbi:response regulator transcription factor [Aquabacterium sp. A7-Y]|uniref:response regulator n=1 Tax=Aquabacterium sp. A7-Y TaxID=1349605 RepID=UPI00223CF0F2|nr:response regulator transcription factor [Aquabacterium sp. A7-Y]MCW7541506.1 response regulator transcription factor [Aquabacterium sp. A7-Y]